MCAVMPIGGQRWRWIGNYIRRTGGKVEVSFGERNYGFEYPGVKAKGMQRRKDEKFAAKFEVGVVLWQTNLGDEWKVPAEAAAKWRVHARADMVDPAKMKLQGIVAAAGRRGDQRRQDGNAQGGEREALQRTRGRLPAQGAAQRIEVMEPLQVPGSDESVQVENEEEASSGRATPGTSEWGGSMTDQPGRDNNDDNTNNPINVDNQTPSQQRRGRRPTEISDLDELPDSEYDEDMMTQAKAAANTDITEQMAQMEPPMAETELSGASMERPGVNTEIQDSDARGRAVAEWSEVMSEDLDDGKAQQWLNGVPDAILPIAILGWRSAALTEHLRNNGMREKDERGYEGDDYRWIQRIIEGRRLQGARDMWRERCWWAHKKK